MVDKNTFDAELAKRKRAEYIKAWRKNNPDKVREYNKRYRENNAEKIKEYNQRYWAKKFESDMAKESEA